MSDRKSTQHADAGQSAGNVRPQLTFKKLRSMIENPSTPEVVSASLLHCCEDLREGGEGDEEALYSIARFLMQVGHVNSTYGDSVKTTARKMLVRYFTPPDLSFFSHHVRRNLPVECPWLWQHLQAVITFWTADPTHSAVPRRDQENLTSSLRVWHRILGSSGCEGALMNNPRADEFLAVIAAIELCMIVSGDWRHLNDQSFIHRVPDIYLYLGGKQQLSFDWSQLLRRNVTDEAYAEACRALRSQQPEEFHKDLLVLNRFVGQHLVQQSARAPEQGVRTLLHLVAMATFILTEV